jgi:hypothetical protein
LVDTGNDFEKLFHSKEKYMTRAVLGAAGLIVIGAGYGSLDLLVLKIMNILKY